MGNAEEMRNHGTRLDDGTSSVELQDFVDIFADLGIKKKYRKKKLKPLKGMLRDIEIPKKEIALLLLIFNSLSCILIVSLFINITLLKSGNILSINEMTPWLLTGIIAGIFFSFFRDLFIKRRLLLVSALLIFSFIVLTIQITILPFNLNVIEPILYLTDSFVVIILFILFMNLFLEYSNLLERGRVLSFLLIENIIFSLLISIVIGFGVINASFFLYFPLILLPFTVYYIQKNQDLERTPSTPSFFKEKHINKSLIKYAVFIFFFSFMIGIGVPLIDVEDSIRMIFIYEEIDITVIHTLILVIASSTLIFLIFGVIFDYIGRLATISGLILFVSIVSFINVFNTPLELLKEAIILGGLVIGIMASALIVGDITKKKNYCSMLVLLSLIYAGGIIIGIIVKGIIFDYSSARYSEDMILLGLEYFISVLSLVLLVNTKETLPHKEQEWFESLIHLYVIHKSGILIYEHSFDKQKNKDSSESDLISGGIIGLIAVLNEIVKGHETLRAIDHGDKKLLFKYSPKKDIIFLLLIREDLITLRTKLDDFSYDFVRFFEEKLNKLDDFTGVKVSDWKKTELLIRRYFKRKYFI